MKFSKDSRIEVYSHKAGGSEEIHQTMLLEIKMKELQNTKEELKRAKDKSMQSWLDSKPLIDELEKLQSSLAATKNRISKADAVKMELESQLETINKSIRSKKEDELKLRATINELNQEMDRAREEMEQVKMEKGEERRARLEIKQVLKLRRRSLRALNLALRAIRLESEAFTSSLEEAIRYVDSSEMDNTTIQLTQEEYYALRRRAKEEAALAEWRISVSTEQRLAAEASRDSALRRLKGLQTDGKLKKGKMKEKTEEKITRAADDQEQEPRIRVGAESGQREIVSPRARAKFKADSSQGNPTEQFRRSRSNYNKRLDKKKKKVKKTSFLVRISTFLVKKITRLFR